MADATHIDARGLSCPLPTLKLRRRLETLAPGDCVELQATDPMSAVDIPHFCAEHGHILVTHHEDSWSGTHPVQVFVIEKGGMPAD